MARSIGSRHHRHSSDWVCPTRLDALARSIADKAARADIEAFCDRQGDHYKAPREVCPSSEATRDVLIAVTYLEMRGLLVHDSLQPDMVGLL